MAERWPDKINIMSTRPDAERTSSRGKSVRPGNIRTGNVRKTVDRRGGAGGRTARNSGGRGPAGNVMKNILMLCGIISILVLVIIIVVVNRRTERQEAASRAVEQSLRESESLSVAASIEESIRALETEAEPEIGLAVCGDGPIRRLTNGYFSARTKADTKELFDIFGHSDPTQPDAELSRKLSAQASWIRSFDDVEVWTLPGKDENSVIGVVKYRINFRRVNAKAPCIMYFYAEKDENDNWHMRENLLKETRELIAQRFEETGVNDLIEENTKKLRAVLAEDSDLALVYTAFQSGEIYSDQQLDPNRVPEVKVFSNPADSILIN